VGYNVRLWWTIEKGEKEIEVEGKARINAIYAAIKAGVRMRWGGDGINGER
jgi:hypothetical protein